MSRFGPLAEIALVFAVFFIQGAVPVPDVNEPCYLGKAIHFWNPEWAAGDLFLESADTHLTFYVTFGWLSIWLSPPALAWVGAAFTWALLAWAWQRLSFALVPKRWCSVLTAALLVCLVERCHMAGEWIIGGVEAKGFGFVLVLLGLEAMVRGRWNRAWLLFGAGGAFHALVGGWAAVAAGMAWLLSRDDDEKPRHCGAGDQPHWLGQKVLRLLADVKPMLPALVGGLVLSLPGLVPSLLTNWGVGHDVIRKANELYVYQRLGHHLDPVQFPLQNVVRFAVLIGVWAAMCLITPAEPSMRRFRAWIVGTLVLALIGVLASQLELFRPDLAAALLRYYWFRLSDVAVPMGVALGVAALVVRMWQSRPAIGRLLGAAVAVVAVVHVGGHAMERLEPMNPPAARLESYGSWRLACDWIAQSGKIPADARFLTPLISQTFKWYTGRAEVVNWKEVPQDAPSIVEWWRRLEQIHGTGNSDPLGRWRESLARVSGDPERTAWQLKKWGAEYQVDYVLTEVEPPLPLEPVYENRVYVVYRLPPREERR